MSYVAVSPGDAPPKGLAGLGELSLMTPVTIVKSPTDDPVAAAKHRAVMRARGTADAKTGVYKGHKLADDQDVLDYQEGWKSVKPLPKGIVDLAARQVPSSPDAPPDAPPSRSLPSAPPAASSKTPMIVAGVVVLAAAAFWFMRRKKPS